MYPMEFYNPPSVSPSMIRPDLQPNTGPMAVSQEFYQAVAQAIAMASQSDDQPIAYMAYAIPVYAQSEPTEAMKSAGGCAACTFLGLWTDGWAGFTAGDHGLIMLFERGIRAQGGDLTQQTLRVLLHEFDHALSRDHVLERLGLPNMARHQ